jgi:arylsulfatase A-like enzyme
MAVTRNERFMKYRYFLFVLPLLSLLIPEARTASKPARPNIVFILADDLGIVDVNAYAAHFTGAGKEEMFFETPHIDRLVREGTAFSQAYACQLCSPTRASLLTGKNAARVGFTTAVGGNVRTFYNQAITPPPGYLAQDAIEWADKQISIPQALLNGTTIDALPSGRPEDKGRDEITIAEALVDYHAAFLGKWHLGGHGSAGWQPKDQGFEEIAYFDEGGSPYFNWREVWDSRKLIHPKTPQDGLLRGKSGGDLDHEYLTDELTEHAVRFLERQADPETEDGRPFFLYFCHFAVHTPFQAMQEDIAYFEKKPTRGWNGQSNAVYAGMVKRLDDSVGRILKTLEKTGLEQNTLVVFMSDNGGVTYTNPTATCNAPFKGGKAMHFEGGIRVPLVFRWKGRIPQGQWCNVPVDCNDLFPTILDLAGYDPEPFYRREKIDGRSIAPLFDDLTNSRGGYPRNTFFWHYPLNVIVINPDDNQPLAPHSSIREGDWKLVFDWSGILKLYHISEDPFEQHEMSAEMPDKTAAMFRRLNDWLDENVAIKYMPALNPDYDPATEVRSRPFIDLRGRYLGDERAIRKAKSDPRFALIQELER